MNKKKPKYTTYPPFICKTCGQKQDLTLNASYAVIKAAENVTGYIIARILIKEKIKNEPYGRKTMEKQKWNPRYITYAKAHNKTPELMVEYDKRKWPNNYMTGFIIWLKQKRYKFDKQYGDQASLTKINEFTKYLQQPIAKQCNHEYINPTNEIIDTLGYKICIKCGKISEPTE